MSVTERFLRYVQVETTSDDNAQSCPSTDGQLKLGRMLTDELEAMGIEARQDANGYVYGVIPAKGSSRAKVGLIAHMDTSNAVLGPTRPKIIHYEGGPITLENGVVIDGFDFLPSLAGKDLIVTDGTSVLGADDKAGVAEIMELAARLMQDDAPDHAELHIGFTPDEEIGRGADLFDVPGFGADYAYTVDGGALGELEYENFNAASCIVTVRGVSIHPGSAKNQMMNASTISMQFHGLLPHDQVPECTEGYEGFSHLTRMEGNCEKAMLVYIIRDHDRAKFEAKKQNFLDIAAFLNKRYGEGTVTCALKDSYFNMAEIMVDHMDILEKAKAAYRACGVEPVIQPIRGGTDGARLSFMGLPCPNLSTGGFNYHGRKELIPVQSLETMVDVLENLIRNA